MLVRMSFHEDFRNQGYGPMLQKEGLKKSAPISNISTYTHPQLARKIEKTFMMKSRWDGGSYNLDITKALKKIASDF